VSKSSVTVAPEVIVVPDSLESYVLHQARLALEEQARSGINRDGQRIVGKDGRTLDLHDTGRLWQDVTEAPAQGGLVFGAPYAEAVLTKYKADALSQANQEDLEAQLQERVSNQITSKEE